MSHEVLITWRQSIFIFFANPGWGRPQHPAPASTGILRPASAWICKKKNKNALVDPFWPELHYWALSTNFWNQKVEREIFEQRKIYILILILFSKVCWLNSNVLFIDQVRSRGMILHVTLSETRSVCVEHNLNTRRCLVNALVMWHVSYKITALLGRTEPTSAGWFSVTRFDYKEA